MINKTSYTNTVNHVQFYIIT